MKFNVIGLNDHKIHIALAKLLKAFDRNNELSSETDAKTVDLKTQITTNKIMVELCYQNIQISDETEIINSVSFDKKYLILSCFYHLLEQLTDKTLSYGVLTGIRPTKLVRMYKNRYPHQVREILHKKFCVTYEKIDLLLKIIDNEELLLTNEIKNEVSVYINIPYCLSRCSYCSFTSYSCSDKKVPPSVYIETLIEEIKGLSEYLQEKDIKITTIYIGGGTPTALNEEELKCLLEHVENYLLINPVKEYTLECGRPDTLTENKLKLIKKHHVSRISINPQTFNENTLKKVNRRHSVHDIIRVYHLAKRYGIDDINMDLIIGLPDETFTDFKNSIDQTLALEPKSITIHYLAQKRGSQLFDEELTNVQEDYFRAFEYAYQTLHLKGYDPYYLYRQKNIAGNLENIGYSKKGFESLYNILMIEERQNIIGLGCHASSKFLNHELILNPKDLVSYVKSYKAYFIKKIKVLNQVLFRK